MAGPGFSQQMQAEVISVVLAAVPRKARPPHLFSSILPTGGLHEDHWAGEPNAVSPGVPCAPEARPGEGKQSLTIGLRRPVIRLRPREREQRGACPDRRDGDGTLFTFLARNSSPH
jgi:hypothetical protein